MSYIVCIYDHLRKFPPLYVGYLSTFPTRNGTGILFIPAYMYIDHGSTSGQSNGASRCYVVCYLLYGFLETLSALCGESANVDR